jgi:hypothetical protein
MQRQAGFDWDCALGKSVFDANKAFKRNFLFDPA